MKIRVTLEFTDEELEGLAILNKSQSKKATRDDVLEVLDENIQYIKDDALLALHRSKNAKTK
jgi:hypothetical protein